MDKETLVNLASGMATTAGEGLSWIDKNEDRVRSIGKSPEVVKADLRRQARTARKLARAAQRGMCVGVFGPSQAGKSYLLSSLARDESDKVIVEFGSETHDFISELNPFGGKESTGLVTRFTIKKPSNLPVGFPVQVRLFSETELVKIFANSYYKDAQHKEAVNKDEIIAAIEALKSKAKPGLCTHITLDDLEDLREYVSESFKGLTRSDALGEVYWKEAIELGQHLELEDRAKLYGIIWDNVPEFTQMFLSLAKDLEKLGNPEEAFCEMGALKPVEASIIDVSTLVKNDFSKFGVGNTIKMRGTDGKVAEISRKNATAIIAELRLVMKSKSADYFDHTDLLDFPGYKGRLESPDIKQSLQDGKEESQVEQFFRRGKVDYLFQRYNAENELTSLLLCVATTDQVEGLAQAVEDWIRTTHGATPEARSNAKTALFYILTKADRYFEQKQGDMTKLWDNTIEGNFLDHFGGSRSQKTRWVKEWTPGKSFNNMFLLRNINVPFTNVMDIDASKKELGINPNRQEWADTIKQIFLDSESVRKYFSDPQRAFDELMKLNDGGMEYIKTALAPVCEPGLKLSQVSHELKNLAEAMFDTLNPYYNSGDQAQEMKKRTIFFGNFGKMFKNPYFLERFPELLSNFKIAPEKLFYMRPEAEKKYEAYRKELMENLRQEIETEPAPVNNDDPLDILSMFDEPTAPTPTSEPRLGDRDANSFFSQRIIEAWSEKMRDMADSEDAKEYYQFTRPVFMGMIDELEQGVTRLKIQEKLESKFREISEPIDVSPESKARKQAAFAIGALNDFVSWLGNNPADTAESQRVVNYQNQPVSIFKNKPEIEEYPPISETFVPFSRQWYKDWLTAFYGLIMDNVAYADGGKIDLEANSRLGDIIKKIEEAKASA